MESVSTPAIDERENYSFLTHQWDGARIMRWVFWCIVFGAVGGGLCMFSKNGGPIPLNKNLWSVSYCLVAASTALFVKAVLYYIIEVKNWRGCRPLYCAGQNSLFLFVASEVFINSFPLNGILEEPTHFLRLINDRASVFF